jgi:ABC-type polysaccharide/polyol phosphate transport system ATPase subunit
VARIVLENVSAHFPIYGAQQRSLRKAIIQRATGGSIEREGKNSERVVVKALNDISLTLNDGDRVGLIGHNGAGKSTLLKLMAGIYEPVSGTVRVEGRVTPLFDTMPGLDAEDSGYENIITSGMLIGMTRRQIEAKIPAIEEFCELGEYLNLPVRTYSTGMTMRLGFALVTALDPGVLLMDEGFGTGDLRFAERALSRMKDFIGRSQIMVLASHSDNTIRSMCNKAVLMQAGKMVAFGPVDEVCDRYYELVHSVTTRKTAQDTGGPGLRTAEVDGAKPASRYSGISIRDVNLGDRLSRTNGAVRFTKAIVPGAEGNSSWECRPGGSLKFRFEYEVLESVSDLDFLFRVFLPSNSFGRSEQIVADVREVLSPGRLYSGATGAVDFEIRDINLMSKQYSLYIFLGRTDLMVGYDVIDANIGLPPLVVTPSREKGPHHGVVSLKYEMHKGEPQVLDLTSGSES